jgi:hypothetical protein
MRIIKEPSYRILQRKSKGIEIGNAEKEEVETEQPRGGDLI